MTVTVLLRKPSCNLFYHKNENLIISSEIKDNCKKSTLLDYLVYTISI